jgi:prepilin-type N-terminal cleavage/methylation domain-containing protein
MHPPITKTWKLTGFTLIELAVVLIIIALVTSMGMVATVGTIENTKRTSTDNRMDAIEKALMDFRNKYNRLPCPADPTLAMTDTNSGKELRDATLTTECDNANPTLPPYLIADIHDVARTTEGGVPTKSLGLPDEFMFDGWGRRFMYTIPITAGVEQSFKLFIRPQEQECAASIQDSTLLSYRSYGPIYVLLSFGPNGHGAFTNGTTRAYSPLATDPHEFVNCRCTVDGTLSDAAFNYLFSSGIIATWIIPAGEFDDIIRFKERWQMQNEEDARVSANYKDYVLTVTYDGVPPTFVYKFNGCTRDLIKHPGVDQARWYLPTPTTPATDAWHAGNVFFDGDTLFFYTNSSTNPIQPYHFTRNTVDMSTCTDINDCVPTVPASSTTTTNAVAVSNNHYVAVGYSEAVPPFVQVYRATNTDTARPLLTPLSTPLAAAHLSAFTTLPTLGAKYGQPTSVFPTGHAPSAAPRIIALSKNADYMFLTDSDGVGGGSYATMYARVGSSTFKKLDAGNQPSLTVTAIGSAAFSPDGKYFAAGVSGTPAVKIWRLRPGMPFISGGTSPLVTVTFPSISFPGAVPPMVAFSPDGLYFVAVGGVASVPGPVHAGNIFIYKIDNNDTFTSITPNITGTYDTVTYGAETVIPGLPVLFTPDSNQFFFATSHAGGSAIIELDKASVDTWRLKYPFPEAFSSPVTAPTAMAITPP